jgi:NAD(P)-dependent dehydrogenase (short-subunit alcohol dehydrogenase family)
MLSKLLTGKACLVAGRAGAVNADVTNEESGSLLLAETIRQFGKLDVLVNNAGIMNHFDGAGDLNKSL